MGRIVTALVALIAVLIVGVVAVFRIVGRELPGNNPISERINQTNTVVEEESVVIDVVERVSPSVVSIAVESRQLDPFFGFGETARESGIGTGFIVSKDGLIITNKHVVSLEGEKYIAVINGGNGDERKLEITQINRDPFNDLAIVKVDASDLAPIELGDSDKIKVGQKVIAIGNALGRFENTVTTGIVSGLGRGVAPIDPTTGVAESLSDLIQTDAAINPGNSGGPLVNTSGQVIGINTAVADAQNIGFAIKVNVAKQLLDDFQSSGGRIIRPLLGIRYTHISRDVALLNEVPEGELVREIVAESGAAKAGVKIGDIITHLDDQRLSEENSLANVVRVKKVGDSIKIRLFREGQTLDLTAKLGEAKE